MWPRSGRLRAPAGPRGPAAHQAQVPPGRRSPRRRIPRQARQLWRPIRASTAAPRDRGAVSALNAVRQSQTRQQARQAAGCRYRGGSTRRRPAGPAGQPGARPATLAAGALGGAGPAGRPAIAPGGRARRAGRRGPRMARDLLARSEDHHNARRRPPRRRCWRLPPSRPPCCSRPCPSCCPSAPPRWSTSCAGCWRRARGARSRTRRRPAASQSSRRSAPGSTTAPTRAWCPAPRRTASSCWRGWPPGPPRTS